MEKLFIGLALMIGYSNGLIVPQELPSVLSLVYSNIPPIKKGTDSRFGFGFRLGEHADYQVLIELGPQKYTKPLGKGADSDDASSDTSKRMVDQTDYSKKPKQPPVGTGNQWLNTWANEMKVKPPMQQYIAKPPTKPANAQPPKVHFNSKDQLPLPMQPLISQSALRQLQQLYVKQSDKPTVTIEQPLGTLPSITMEAHAVAVRSQLRKEKPKVDLSDVSLD